MLFVRTDGMPALRRTLSVLKGPDRQTGPTGTGNLALVARVTYARSLHPPKFLSTSGTSYLIDYTFRSHNRRKGNIG
jgi:hypothetical protein